MKRALIAFLLAIGCFSTAARADPRAVEVIAAVKPALVGIGTHDPLRQPASDLLGTGFAVADGHHVLTALHVINSRGSAPGGQLSVFVGTGDNAEIRKATKVAEDPVHDVALLKIEGAALPPVPLYDGPLLPDGTSVVFCGFPVGAVYGLYPASQRAMIAATTPLARPSTGGQALTAEMISALKQQVLVYQLDGMTLPGNSGGPVVDLAAGKVIAIVDASFVQQTKDAGNRNVPSVGFAMPIDFGRALVKKLGLTRF